MRSESYTRFHPWKSPKARLWPTKEMATDYGLRRQFYLDLDDTLPPGGVMEYYFPIADIPPTRQQIAWIGIK